MDKKRLQKVRPGDPINASDWNALIEMVLRNDIKVSAGCGLNISKTSNGTLISVPPRYNQRLAKTSSTISARSGTTAGTGTVTPQKFDGTTIADSGYPDITVYLFSSSASIASGKYCWIAQDLDGYWWITAVEC